MGLPRLVAGLSGAARGAKLMMGLQIKAEHAVQGKALQSGVRQGSWHWGRSATCRQVTVQNAHVKVPPAAVPRVRQRKQRPAASSPTTPDQQLQAGPAQLPTFPSWTRAQVRRTVAAEGCICGRRGWAALAAAPGSG